MSGEIDVEWDVDFWANRYPVDDLAIYNRALTKPAADRLRALWRWKTLHRAEYTPDDLSPFLDDARRLCDGIDGTVAEAPVDAVTDAFVELRGRYGLPRGRSAPARTPLSRRSSSSTSPTVTGRTPDGSRSST